MFFSVAVMIVSAALFLFYLQATCERILRRQFDQQYVRSVASAHHLEFASLGRASVRPVSIPTTLRVDFLKLTSLMKDAEFKDCCSHKEYLLILYFRAVLLLLVTGQVLGAGEDKAIKKLTAILQYFANLIGERENAIQRGGLTPSEYLIRV